MITTAQRNFINILVEKLDAPEDIKGYLVADLDTLTKKAASARIKSIKALKG